MGDRFYLKLKCAYCGKQNNDVYYAPTCCFYDFKCDDVTCNKMNFITAIFEVKKAEDVTEEDVIQAFEMASSASHSLDAIKKEARAYLRTLKKQLQSRT